MHTLGLLVALDNDPMMKDAVLQLLDRWTWLAIGVFAGMMIEWRWRTFTKVITWLEDTTCRLCDSSRRG